MKSFFQQLVEISIKVLGHASQILVNTLFNIAVMLLCSYFLFRYGKNLMEQLVAVLTYFGGQKCVKVFELIESTIKGVVYGALLTAIAQGILAGIGFYFAGAPMPALFALATVVISFIPFGAPMVYVPLSIYLFSVTQDSYAGVGLLIYCISVVSTIDNVIRPVFISHAIQISLLLVFVGVVGGIFAFGLIGLFIGPVIIALVQALWKEIVSNARSLEKTILIQKQSA